MTYPPAVTAAVDQLHAQIYDRALTDLAASTRSEGFTLTHDQQEIAELGIACGIAAVMATIKANGWEIGVAR